MDLNYHLFDDNVHLSINSVLNVKFSSLLIVLALNYYCFG